jgi:WD40 repeat protein
MADDQEQQLMAGHGYEDAAPELPPEEPEAERAHAGEMRAKLARLEEELAAVQQRVAVQRGELEAEHKSALGNLQSKMEKAAAELREAIQREAAATDARLKQAEAALRESREQNEALQAALKQLHERVDSLEAARAAAPAAAAAAAAAASPAAPRVGSAAKRTPTLRRNGVESPAPAESGDKAATMPRSLGRTLSQQALEAKGSPAAGDKARPGSVNKLLGARLPSEHKDLAEGVDAAQKAIYSVSGHKIPVLLPKDAVPLKNAAPELPAAQLKMAWLFGYNGAKARSNLYFAHGNPAELVYHSAGTGVVLDMKSNSQRHFTQHNEDILTLARHPKLPIVATGQQDPKGRETPYICVWNTETMEMLKKITYHSRGVCALAFSQSGRYLLSVGLDDNHTAALWDWQAYRPAEGKKGDEVKPLLEQGVSKDQVFAVAFNQRLEKKDEEVMEFVSLGVKHVKHWSVTNAADKATRKMESRIPSSYQKTGEVQKAFHCVAFAENGEYLVGTHSGHIYRFQGSSLVKHYQAHGDKCGAICATPAGFVTTGDDGTLKVWDKADTMVSQFALGPADGGEPLAARALDVAGDTAIVGLKSNRILSVNLRNGAVTEVTAGHTGEVWALAVHPSQPLVVSGGHDRTLRVFDYARHAPAPNGVVAFHKEKEDAVRSAAFSPDGKLLVVGLLSGRVALLDERFQVLAEAKVSKERVDAVAFAPDGKTVAAGTWAQEVLVLAVPDLKVLHNMGGHSSSVTHVQFSVDGTVLMTNSKAYDLLFWDVTKGKRINAGEVVETQWAAWNCVFGWAVQGIWADTNDGTDINAVDRSRDGQLLAAGDDSGQVRLFKYPVLAPKAPMRVAAGHSSHVTNVRFSPDGRFLFSAGGEDSAVVQWSVVA